MYPIVLLYSVSMQLSGFLRVSIFAAVILGALGLMTNQMVPKFDMAYYIDIANHGILNNPKLAAPFAYRFAAPILVGLMARVLGLAIVAAFRISAVAASFAFIVACYYFAASLKLAERFAAVAALAFALAVVVVKWNIFSGAMVDIYAYPILLLAFWAMLRGRVLLCVLISGVGLLFKEFLLLPLLTQAAVIAFNNGIREWRKTVWPLALTAAALGIFFVLPRALIHITGSFQNVDPINKPESLNNLLAYPLSWQRDFNIVYSYLAFWLPVLLLLTWERLKIVRERWRGAWSAIAVFMFLHFLLVMYGGTNIMIFVSYSVPVAILVLAAVLHGGRVAWWEPILMLAVVFVFNRDWAQIPLPSNYDEFVDFFGGYHDRVNMNSFRRMAELLLWIAGFWTFRSLAYLGL